MRAPLALVIFSAVVPSCLLGSQGSDFSDFQTCLASATGPQWNGSTHTCTLPYYSAPYMVGSTITISSSSIRYVSTGSSGVASSYPQATLKRDVSSANLSSPFAILSASWSGEQSPHRKLGYRWEPRESQRSGKCRSEVRTPK